jgi:hypothetical protein
VRFGHVARNVAALADPPLVGHFTTRPLTPAEANRFLDTVTGNRLEALYRVVLSLGLRQGGVASASRTLDHWV